MTDVHSIWKTDRLIGIDYPRRHQMQELLWRHIEDNYKSDYIINNAIIARIRRCYYIL